MVRQKVSKNCVWLQRIILKDKYMVTSLAITILEDFSGVDFPLYEHFSLLSLFSTQNLLKPLMEWQLTQHLWIYIG